MFGSYGEGMMAIRDCEVQEGCENRTNRRCRGCGRYACGSCVDRDTELCMYCVPVDAEAYQQEAMIAAGL